MGTVRQQYLRMQKKNLKTFKIIQDNVLQYYQLMKYFMPQNFRSNQRPQRGTNQGRQTGGRGATNFKNRGGPTYGRGFHQGGHHDRHHGGHGGHHSQHHGGHGGHQNQFPGGTPAPNQQTPAPQGQGTPTPNPMMFNQNMQEFQGMPGMMNQMGFNP